MQIPPPDLIRPIRWRSDLTVSRSSGVLVSCLVLALFVLNALSQRRSLVCQYQAAQPRCQLTAQRLVGAAEAVPLGELKAAVLVKQPGRHKGKDSTFYQVILETDRGRFWLTSNDRWDFGSKAPIVEEINRFLAQPQAGALRIDSGQSSLFWMMGKIFGSLSLFFLSVTGLTVWWWWRDRERST
jgi:hypothetical protein